MKKLDKMTCNIDKQSKNQTYGINLSKELVVCCSIAREYGCGFLTVEVVPNLNWNNFY
ncbi:hypothetical protein [Clostridium sp.]|uniref:hypothetical protein n=1 Tax=Clostridium sp. TaxID=1506 RepID=UPI0028527BDF|nr:hypothetical protein [Clostridium sp.]